MVAIVHVPQLLQAPKGRIFDSRTRSVGSVESGVTGAGWNVCPAGIPADSAGLWNSFLHDRGNRVFTERPIGTFVSRQFGSVRIDSAAIVANQTRCASFVTATVPTACATVATRTLTLGVTGPDTRRARPRNIVDLTSPDRGDRHR